MAMSQGLTAGRLTVILGRLSPGDLAALEAALPAIDALANAQAAEPHHAMLAGMGVRR